ncbi:unnamed protein product [Polarella glacialis]|uniref:PPPDE domain-containing protein n=1 Tax=Polarella glacialis TaxID=89957 RepID=A0A813JL83_POLGL|nr:unnamed protein product [Polarella glacialis]
MDFSGSQQQPAACNKQLPRRWRQQRSRWQPATASSMQHRRQQQQQAAAMDSPLPVQQAAPMDSLAAINSHNCQQQQQHQQQQTAASLEPIDLVEAMVDAMEDEELSRTLGQIRERFMLGHVQDQTFAPVASDCPEISKEQDKEHKDAGDAAELAAEPPLQLDPESLGASGPSAEIPRPLSRHALRTVQRRKPGLRVRLHIYDVSLEPNVQLFNRILAHESSPLKFGGVFHAGVEVNGLEWAFGQSEDENVSGISCCAPKKHLKHHYRETVKLPRTNLSPEEVARLMSELLEQYPGDEYDLLHRNCCHFADDFSQRLGVGNIPSWVYRLARIGASLDRLLEFAPEPVRELLPW